jgi:hypothetical protein
LDPSNDPGIKPKSGNWEHTEIFRLMVRHGWDRMTAQLFFYGEAPVMAVLERMDNSVDEFDRVGNRYIFQAGRPWFDEIEVFRLMGALDSAIKRAREVDMMFRPYPLTQEENVYGEPTPLGYPFDKFENYPSEEDSTE